jgi:hypothetical protein
LKKLPSTSRGSQTLLQFRVPKHSKRLSSAMGSQLATGKQAPCQSCGAVCSIELSTIGSTDYIKSLLQAVAVLARLLCVRVAHLVVSPAGRSENDSAPAEGLGALLELEGAGMLCRCCAPQTSAMHKVNHGGHSPAYVMHQGREVQGLNVQERRDILMQSLSDQYEAEAGRDDRNWMSACLEPSSANRDYRRHGMAEPGELQGEAAEVSGRREGERRDRQPTQDQPEANPNFKRIPIHSNATYNRHPLTLKEYNHEAALERFEQLEEYHGSEFEAAQEKLDKMQKQDAELYLQLRCVPPCVYHE